MNGSSKAGSLSNAGSPFRRLILESFLNTKAFLYRVTYYIDVHAFLHFYVYTGTDGGSHPSIHFAFCTQDTF